MNLRDQLKCLPKAYKVDSFSVQHIKFESIVFNVHYNVVSSTTYIFVVLRSTCTKWSRLNRSNQLIMYINCTYYNSLRIFLAKNRAIYIQKRRAIDLYKKLYNDLIPRLKDSAS